MTDSVAFRLHCDGLVVCRAMDWFLDLPVVVAMKAAEGRYLSIIAGVFVYLRQQTSCMLPFDLKDIYQEPIGLRVERDVEDRSSPSSYVPRVLCSDK